MREQGHLNGIGNGGNDISMMQAVDVGSSFLFFSPTPPLPQKKSLVYASSPQVLVSSTKKETSITSSQFLSHPIQFLNQTSTLAWS